MLIVRELLNLHLRAAEPGFPVELWNLRACQQLFNITVDKTLGMAYALFQGNYCCRGLTIILYINFICGKYAYLANMQELILALFMLVNDKMSELLFS